MLKFYKCSECDSIVTFVKNSGVDMTCNGSAMVEIIPGTTDAAVEKHVPVYEKVEDELVVKVGAVEHPMEKEHYIMWIAQVTENRTIRVKLYPEQATETRFPYIKGATIYAYCNKHGLWKTII